MHVQGLSKIHLFEKMHLSSTLLEPKLLVVLPKCRMISSCTGTGSNNLEAQPRKPKNAIERLVALTDMLEPHFLAVCECEMNVVRFDQSGDLVVDFLNLDEF